MSQKSLENSQMSDASTVSGASQMMQQLWPAGKVGERILAAHRALKWEYSRTRDLWYAKARRIDGVETARLHDLKMKRQEKIIGEAANEYAELTARLARMETMLASIVSNLGSAPSDGPQP